MKKPPIGLKPKYIHRLERLNEVKKAMCRYFYEGIEIPLEWVEEYNELIKKLK